MRQFSLIFCWLFFVAGAVQAETGISVSVMPRTIAAGDQAQLNVVVAGGGDSRPVIPEIDGLTIATAGQSKQIQIINGAMSVATTYLYRVRGDASGTYTIPPITVSIGGAVVKSSPVKLEVLPAASAKGRRKSSGTPSFAPSQEDEEQGETDDEAPGEPLVRTSSLKNELYVGEAMPLQIKAFFPPSIRLENLVPPVIEGDGFALQTLKPEPEQGQEMLNGQVCNVFTWNSNLSAVKEGNFSIRIGVKGHGLVRQQRRHRSFFGSQGMLDEDFLSDFFGRTQPRDFDVRTKPNEINVKALPSEGRPANFSGAVGRYQVSSSASVIEVNAGDPITTRITVKGRGNFDRVQAPILTDGKGWKTYKPTSSFEPLDSVGYEGRKQFEVVVVPTDGSTAAIPAFEFSYFDANEGRYVTQKTDPIPVKVNAAKLLSDEARESRSDAAPREEKKGDGFLPIEVEFGSPVETLVPLVITPLAWWLSGAAILLMVLALMLDGYAKRTVGDVAAQTVKESKRRVKDALLEMERGLSEKDGKKFFAGARRALQESYAVGNAIVPETITVAELTRLGASSEVFQLFERADEVAYSKVEVDQEELRRWQEVVLKRVES